MMRLFKKYLISNLKVLSIPEMLLFAKVQPKWICGFFLIRNHASIWPRIATFGSVSFWTFLFLFLNFFISNHSSNNVEDKINILPWRVHLNLTRKKLNTQMKLFKTRAHRSILRLHAKDRMMDSIGSFQSIKKFLKSSIKTVFFWGISMKSCVDISYDLFFWFNSLDFK